MENGVINPRIHPTSPHVKFVTVLGLINMGTPFFAEPAGDKFL